MNDLVFLVLLILFFLITFGLVLICRRLMRS
jgi:hypothetical protein